MEKKQEIEDSQNRMRSLVKDYYGESDTPTADTLKPLLVDLFHYAASNTKVPQTENWINKLVEEARDQYQADRRLASGLVIEDGDEIAAGNMSRVVCRDCAAEVVWTDEDQNHGGEWSGSCRCPDKSWGAETETVTVTID